ncbi:MAG TPA: chemotaxis protein CheW [Roseiflexaceae bacterium]|jgi:purine-binding chemotaxis protein CheW
MKNALLAPAPVISKGGDALIVIFQIGRQLYGLPLPFVLEIVRLPALVSLAGAPPTLCGLLNLRGQYLPIMDGCTLVGAPSLYDLNSQIVIAGRNKPELGLLVDQVRDVCAVATSRIAPIDRRDVAAFLTNVFDWDDGSVLLFDLTALLALRPSKSKLKSKNSTRSREPRTD